MRRSAPFGDPVAIHGEVSRATFDSGASISVMSSKLAKRLELPLTGGQGY